MTKYIPILLFLLSSCAQFVPPTGGDKDKTPPELTVSYPVNKTRNFNGRQLNLEFNELIDASALRQELIVSPEPPGPFDLKEKPYGIEIKFDKPFRDSTTYTFNFRNGIKDLTERNPALNLKLVFSTGPEIDSLTLKGKVENLWNGLPAEKITVGLYNLEDLIDTIPLLKTKPSYFIKTDSSGLYNFENLKAGNYRLLSFNDLNQNLIPDLKDELFAFHPDTLKLDTLNTDVNLAVYPANTEAIKVKRSLSRQSYFLVQYNKPLKEIELQFPETDDSLTARINNDEVHIFAHPSPSDTTLTKILVQDSIGNRFEHDVKIYFNTTTKSKPELIQLSETVIRNNAKIKTPTYYEFKFPYPITRIDTSGINIVSDSTTKETFNLQWLDPSHTLLRINISPKAKKYISLNIDSGSITSYKSDTNITYSLFNTLYQQDDFGSMEGTYTEFEGQKIIELLEADKYQIIDKQIFTDKFYFPEVIPGTYRLRIIEDRNTNGRWDAGDFEKYILPERILVSKGTLKLKANFQLSDVQIE